MKVKKRRDAAESPLKGSRLKYQQVKDYLLRQIAEGHLKPGDALPPVRALAKDLGRGVQTVRHALGELSRDNVILCEQGKGTFVNREHAKDRKKKLAVFALVVPEMSGSLYPSLTKGFVEAASESYHQVVICDTHRDTNYQGDVILQLLNKHVAGVAIVPMTTPPMPLHQVEVLRSQGIPLVFCHRRPEGAAAPLITWPWEQVGRRAGEAMLEHGHRRVAYVAMAPYMISDAYVKGLRGVLAERGLDLPAHRELYSMEVSAPPAEDEAHRKLAEMLEAPDRPTAVFCSDAIEAERVFLEAVRLGLSVPDDLSIVGFGCVWRDGLLSQRLAAVTIDEREMGRRAALLLSQMQAGQQRPDSEDRILVPLGFSEGRTLGPAPGEPLLTECGSISSCGEGNGKK